MAIPTGRDQRRFERFVIAMKVELIYPDGTIHLCTTRNISEGGIFVLLPNTAFPPLGEMVTINKVSGQDISIELPNDTAVVVHKDENGIGLAFVDLSLGMDLD
ncbi:MAG: PilZ domain-containing protein [Gammaproteobacteria bacterium]|nr:PilZ domain-containing protein [Gammaproteobacteria bacterium]